MGPWRCPSGALLQGAWPWTLALPLLFLSKWWLPLSLKSPSEFMTHLPGWASESSLSPLLSPARMTQSGICFRDRAREIRSHKTWAVDLCQSKGGQGEREMTNASLISKLLHDPAWEHVKLLKRKSNALKGHSVDGKLAGCFVPAVYSHTKQSKCRLVTQWKLLGIISATLILTQLIPHQLELCKIPFLVSSVHPHPDATSPPRAQGAGVDQFTFQVNI